MILKIQIYSLLFSFAYGILIYFILELIHKIIYNKKLILRIMFSLLFSLLISIAYFICLLNINNGILHEYFFLMVLIGYTLAKFVYLKLFVKRKWICYNDIKVEGDSLAKKIVKKKKKFGKRAKSRLFLAFLLFGTVISMLSYKFFYNIKQIRDMKEQKVFLEEQLVKLEEEEKILESDIQKLEDPTYIARYAREKYLYSKDGELIIRLPDDD